MDSQTVKQLEVIADQIIALQDISKAYAAAFTRESAPSVVRAAWRANDDALATLKDLGATIYRSAN